MSSIATRREPCPGLLAALAIALSVTAAAPALGQEKAWPATCAAAPGALLARTKAGWQAIKAGEAVTADTPLVSLFDAQFRSANGAVEVRLLADPAQRGPFPILESSLVLHADAKNDLALSPRAGLIVLTNTKTKGAAVIRLSLQADSVELTLKGPGAKLALEVYGRHAPGEPKLDDAKLDDPVFHLFFIVLKGEAFLRDGDKGIALTAPPGPAILVWDSLVRQPEVKRLEELPPEIAAMREKDAKLLDQINAWTIKLTGESPAAVMKEGAASKVDLIRQAAVTAMGALDDLPALFHVLAASPDAGTRDHAVLVLRHWLGREPGQTGRLNAGLIKAGYTPVQARTLLHLLYGFTPEEKRDPSTYDVLLDSLRHSRPAIRELAHWHLVRLAPDGKKIPYDVLAPEAERERAYEQWRALIPSGKLPPARSAKTP